MNDPRLGEHANRESIIEALNKLSILHQAKSNDFLDAFANDAIYADVESSGLLTDTAIADWIEKSFGQNFHVKWIWETIELDTHHDMGWFLADGRAITVLDETGQENEIRFRLSGVLKCENGNWVWKLFHSSTPASGDE